MLVSSNGLGTLTFNQNNVGSNPIASTKFVSYPITNEMWARVEAVIPYPGFFTELQINGGYVAGGFARYVLGLTPDIQFKDVDVFCLNDTFEKILDVFVMNPWNKYLKDSPMVGVRRHIPYHSEDTHLQNTKFLTYNSRMLQTQAGLDSISYVMTQPAQQWVDYQFISNPNHKSIDDVVASFDITVCGVYIDFLRQKVFCTPEFIEDDLKKNFRMARLSHTLPLQLSEFRTYKYLEKGYRLSLQEALRIQDLIKEHPENKNEYLIHEPRDKAFLSWIADAKIDGRHVFHTDEEYELLKGVVQFTKLPVNMLG